MWGFQWINWHWYRIFGAFCELLENDYQLRHLCPSVRPLETQFPLYGFSWNSIFQRFSKICWENSSFIKIWQEKPVLYMKTRTQFLSHLAHFFVEWDIFQNKFVDKIKTHILCSITLCRKSCRLQDNVENFSRAGQAPEENKCTCALHAGYSRLKTHTQNIYYVLTSQCNNGCTNAPQRYVMRTLSVLLWITKYMLLEYI